MLWSVINETDIFFDKNSIITNDSVRSSNPYDYLRMGYFLDNASIFGGKDFVDFNSNISSNRSSDSIHFSAF